MLSVRTVRTLRILRAYINKQNTSLESEVNKARLCEENHYGLHWALSFTQAESFHDECTVSPVISPYGKPRNPVDPPTVTYHNLYAIINVVTALVAMESD